MTDFLNEIKQNLLGDVLLSTYISAFIISSLVIFLNILVVSARKYKTAVGTPEHWSFKFALLDNLRRALATLIIMFFFYRFAGELMQRELNMFYAFGVGGALTFGIDKVFGFLKSKYDILNGVKRDVPPPSDN